MSIFSLHVGQFGIRVGEEYWSMMEADNNYSRSKNYFYESSSGLTPRCLITDFDNSAIEEIRNNKTSFSKSETVTGLYSDSGCWAYGYYSGGKEIMSKVSLNFTKEIEKCDNLKGIQYFSGISGAAGGGLSSLMLETLKQHVSDIPVVGVHVIPDEDVSFSPMDIYNSVFSLAV